MSVTASQQKGGAAGEGGGGGLSGMHSGVAWVTALALAQQVGLLYSRHARQPTAYDQSFFRQSTFGPSVPSWTPTPRPKVRADVVLRKNTQPGDEPTWMPGKLVKLVVAIWSFDAASWHSSAV